MCIPDNSNNQFSICLYNPQLLFHCSRKFRVIPAPRFVQTFASDRSHMLRDGTWLKPPPPYPPLRTQGEKTDYQDYSTLT